MSESTAAVPEVAPVPPTTAPSEPATTTGSMVGLGMLVVNALVWIGVPLDTQTKIYIIIGVSVLGPLAAALLIRAKVFSPATVERMVNQFTAQMSGAQAQVLQLRGSLDAQRVAHTAAIDVVKATIAEAPQRMVPLPEPPPQRAATAPHPLFGAPPYAQDPAGRQAPPGRPTWPGGREAPQVPQAPRPSRHRMDEAPQRRA